MDRLELRDAYDQIAAIRIQLAATERLRGLRALPVAASGVLALAAAAAQSIWVHDPLRAPQQWLLLWLGAAVLSALAAGLELLRRVRSSGSDLSIANATLAVRQFAPCIAAGAVVTAFVALRLPEQDATFVVLVNLSTNSENASGAIANELIDQLYPGQSVHR